MVFQFLIVACIKDIREHMFHGIGHTDVDGASVVMEPCAEAVAAGDGRELWQYLSGGQIASVVGKKCIAVGAGGAVVLKGCDASSASQWEAQGSGVHHHDSFVMFHLVMNCM